MLYRVKSLSKGNNSKKDPLSSTLNPRESTAVLLPSTITTASPLDEEMFIDSDRTGWYRSTISDNSYPLNAGNGLSGRDGGRSGSLYADSLKEQRGRGYAKGENLNISEKSLEQDKPQRKKGKPEIQSLPFSENKSRNAVLDFDVDGSNSDDGLNALLQVIIVIC